MQTCLQPSWDPNLTSQVPTPGPATLVSRDRDRSLGWVCSAVVPHPLVCTVCMYVCMCMAANVWSQCADQL